MTEISWVLRKQSGVWYIVVSVCLAKCWWVLTFLFKHLLVSITFLSVLVPEIPAPFQHLQEPCSQMPWTQPVASFDLGLLWLFHFGAYWVMCQTSYLIDLPFGDGVFPFRPIWVSYCWVYHMTNHNFDPSPRSGDIKGAMVHHFLWSPAWHIPWHTLW